MGIKFFINPFIGKKILPYDTVVASYPDTVRHWPFQSKTAGALQAYNQLVSSFPSTVRLWPLSIKDAAAPVVAYDTKVASYTSTVRHWPLDEELPA